MTGSAQEQSILRLRQQAQRAEKLDRPVAGRFVAGEERAAAMREAKSRGIAASFWGGWEGAERAQVCFHPAEDEPEFTAVWVEATWHAKFGHADHRALLGSLMALGMDRSLFGDLIAREGTAYLCALPEAAAGLPEQWREAGRTALRVRVLEEPPPIEAPSGVLFRDTVASMRLDGVLASGMKLSRGKAAELIAAGAVMVDHVPEERNDRLLEAGCLLSIRGFGRIRIREVGDPTRKDRLPVVLEIFGGR